MKLLLFKNAKGLIALLLCGALLFAAAGCSNSSGPDYTAMADALSITYYSYGAQSSGDRTRTLKAMNELTWYQDGEDALKNAEIDKRMGSAMDDIDPSAPGSAFRAYCAVTGLRAESYLPPPEYDPALEEALSMDVNTLTARMHGDGIPGARVLINALYESGLLFDGADSYAYFAPKITLLTRAAVEKIYEKERKNNYTSSGEIDYTAEGGYFKELCKTLSIDYDEACGALWALAEVQNDAAAATMLDQKEILDALPGSYTTKNGGELSLMPDGSYALMYGASFSFGSWGFEDGVLKVGGEPAYLEDDGLHIYDVDVPFYKVSEASDPGDGGLTGSSDPGDISYAALEEHSFLFYVQADVTSWYGTTTDTERVAMAAELLSLFETTGASAEGVSANEFASFINNYYDTGDRERAIFDVACDILGIDPAPYYDAYLNG